MADFFYNKFLYHVLHGDINCSSDVFKLALVSSSYTPAVADEVWSAGLQPGSYEITGTNYLVKTVTVSVSYVSGSTTKFTIGASDAQWTNATFACRYAVIYRDSPGTKYLVACFDEDKSVTAGTFLLSPNANGVFTIASA